MPEIVEVRKYADFLRKILKGQDIKSIKIIAGRYKTHNNLMDVDVLKKLFPLKVIDIKTKGKLIYFELDNDVIIMNTLGLFGGWIYYDNNKDKYVSVNMWTYEGNEEYSEKSIKHRNIEFKLESGSLFFFDMLSFGTLKITKRPELDAKLAKIGPDIMEDTTTYDIFKARLLRNSNMEREIGNVLMRQECISGIGNFLRAEILWLSKISPFRKVKKLSEIDIRTLYKSSKIMTWGDYNYEAALKKGIIEKDFKMPFHYKRDFYVYRQGKDVYGNKIKKDILHEGTQKRHIYWTPVIQK